MGMTTDHGLHPAKAEFRRLLVTRARSLGLTLRAIELLVERAAMVTKTSPGQQFCSSDDPTDFVRFVVRGAVRIQAHTEWAVRPMIIRFVGPGHFFCIPPSGNARCPYRIDVVAHDEPVLALLSRAHLQEAIATLPPSGAAQLTSAGWREPVRLLFAKVAMLRSPLAKRIPEELRRLVRSFGRRTEGGWFVELALTHQTIADLVNGSRANVTRALKPLRLMGLFRKLGGRLFVADDLVKGTSNKSHGAGQPGAEQRTPAGSRLGPKGAHQ